jgi:hypothetical protein
LRRFGHTAQMDYHEITPDGLAEAVRQRLAVPANYAPVAPGGVERAAELVAGVLG